MKHFQEKEDGTYEWTEIKKTTPKFTPSQTDKTDFVKDVKGSKSLILGGGTQYIGLYDFPDGRDTGLDLTFLRKKGIDITEVDNMREILQTKAEENIKEVNREIEKIKIQQEINTQEQQNQTQNNQ